MSSYSKLEDPEEEVKRPNRAVWWSIGVGFVVSVVVIVWSQWPFQNARAQQRTRNGMLSSSSKALKVGQMDWWSCSGSDGVTMECGYIIVPLDYLKLDAGVAKIALSRLKSTQKRKGTIFYNPGGPGDSGKQAILNYGKHLQAAIAPDYDWIGFDPRGIGDTQPQVKCFKDGNYKAFLANTVLDHGYDVPPSSNDRLIQNALIRQQQEADTLFKKQFDICKENMGDTLRYMGTTYVSRDVEFMTSTLEGDNALINYYGVSYGSVIGSYILNMFPDRVGRIAIDGVVNPLLWTSQPAYTWYRSWGEDSEAAYMLFFTECSKIGPSRCPLAETQGEVPGKMKDRVQKFLNGLYDKPMPIPGEGTPGLLTSGRAFIRIYVALQHPLAWQNLSIALHEAMQGNATLLMNLGHSTLPNNNEDAPHPDLQRAAVSCNDQLSFSPPTPKQVTDEYVEALGFVSRFTLSIAATEPDTGCQFWPVKPPERFTGPWNHTLKNPILIHSNQLDPVTPLSGGQLINSLLPECSSLVVREGSGHCSFTMPSLCAVKASRAYFKDGTLPPNRHRCPTDVTLFTNEISNSLSDPDQKLMEHVHSIALYFNHIL